MPEISSIGFLGLGAMGGAFCANLVRAGYPVKGYDTSTTACQQAAAVGVSPVETPVEVADSTQLVAVSVPDVPQIKAVLEGPQGLLAAPGNGRIVMLMSTFDPGEIPALAERVASAGWQYLDCPVGRTATEARSGTSTFLIGGSAVDKARVRPVLDALGEAIIDCGDIGHGMLVKIVNNFMSTTGAVLVAEALRLAEAGGVSQETVLEVVNGTVAGNGHSRINFPSKVLAGDVEPGFAIQHAGKDARIARTVFERLGFPNFLAPAAASAYERAVEAGHGDNDWSDLYNVVAALRRSSS